MERLFVTLPVVFGLEDFRAEGALVRHADRQGNLWFQTSTSGDPFLAWSTTHFERVLGF